MVCGILAHNSQKRAAQNRSLFMLDTFTFILAARSVELIARHPVTRELHAGHAADMPKSTKMTRSGSPSSSNG
jgi:hypothetical protein